MLAALPAARLQAASRRSAPGDPVRVPLPLAGTPWGSRWAGADRVCEAEAGVAPASRGAGVTVRLVSGQAPRTMHRRMARGRRMGDVGQRVLAFYLAEMDERRAYQALGCSSTAHYAERHLDLPRRRTRELVSVGRALQSLRRLDEAFADGRLSWSRVLLLVRVATPTCEQAWLEQACALSCRELDLAVRRARPGDGPRAPGDRKGLPEIRFPLRIQLGALTKSKWERVRAKFSAETGEELSDVQVLDQLAELGLQTDADGSVPGRTRIASSLYRIVLHASAPGRPGGVADGVPALQAQTDDGPVPIEGDDRLSLARSAALCCEGEHLHFGAASEPVAPDIKTPPALRLRVLTRDGFACHHCGAPRELHVHHIVHREHGGPTRAENLVTLCLACHGLVHADLLVPEGGVDGPRAATLTWRPIDAGAVAEARAAVRAAEGDDVRVDLAADATLAADVPAALDLARVPAQPDGAWWQRHAGALRVAPGGRLELRSGFVPEPAPAGPEAADVRRLGDLPSPENRRLAFSDLHGLGTTPERLEAEALACEADGEAFPHTLLVGPPGTGKTTLARRIAQRLGARCVEATGSVVHDAPALLGLLAGLDAGDVLLLDEVHAIPRGVLESLYQAMTDRRVPLTIAEGTRVRAVHLALAPFTLVAATTEEGELPRALHSRFDLREQLGLYAPEDLAAIARAAAAARGRTLAPEAALRLARAARGTPREVLRLLRRAPVPLARLASWLGLAQRTVLEHVEPWLVFTGLVEVTRHGRCYGSGP